MLVSLLLGIGISPPLLGMLMPELDAPPFPRTLWSGVEPPMLTGSSSTTIGWKSCARGLEIIAFSMRPSPSANNPRCEFRRLRKMVEDVSRRGGERDGSGCVNGKLVLLLEPSGCRRGGEPVGEAG